LSSRPQINDLNDYYNYFKDQIEYTFITENRTKLFNVLKIWNLLQLENTYFANSNPPHLLMALNPHEMDYWVQMLQNIVGSFMDGLTLANVSVAYEALMTRQIAQKTFPWLKNLIFTVNQISSLDFISFMDVPLLETLQICDSRITLLKPLSKMNSPKLKYFFLN
jgi:hypothetical protein